MKGIFANIIKKAPSPLSFSTIGNDVGISYKTAQEYLEVAKNLFIIDFAYYKEKNINGERKENFSF
jgi:predicted AAA+ superfamily ATPase